MYRALRNERRALIQQLRGIKTVNSIRLCNMTSTEGRAFLTCFNTASGIRLCNLNKLSGISPRNFVSIPQAVFACVTAYPLKPRGC